MAAFSASSMIPFGEVRVLNRTLELVKGHVVVFTDDDVHVPESWVADMASPILEGEAGEAVCGRVLLAPTSNVLG